MGLITEIGADASNYNKVMAGLPGTANKASNEISQSLAKASKAMDTFGGTAAKGANQAGNALQNLSRVAQDAPYGFIGIQNNLNPLLESFQRLKVETGSTGAAFKALVGQLTGAGGIGLALAVVSSAFTIYTMLQQKSSKEAKIAAQTNDEYVESLNAVSRAQVKAEQDGQSELTRLRILYEATQNHKLSLTQRNDAYDELSRKYQKFFPDAEREQTLLGQNKKAYEELATAIMQAAYAKAYEEEITSLEKEKIVNSNKIIALKKQETTEQNKLNKARSIEGLGYQGGMGGSGFLNRDLQATGKLNDLIQQRTALEAKNAQIQMQQSELSTKALDAETAAHFKTGGALDDKNKKIKEQKTELQLLQTQLETLQNAEVQWLNAGNKQDPFNLTKTERDINALILKIETLKNSINGVSTTPDLKSAGVKINAAPSQADEKQGFDRAKNSLAGLIKLKSAAIVQNKEYSKTVKEEDSNLKLLSMTVGQGLQGAFQAAITGTQSFADAFGEFITQLIAKIVSAIAAAAVLAALLSFTGLGSIMGATGGFGGGATELGSFANLLGQFTGVKLATGGVTTGPTHALIGEGREQEAVLPLSHLDKMLANNNNGGGMSDGQIVGIMRGSDLLLQWKRAKKQAKRIGGA